MNSLTFLSMAIRASRRRCHALAVVLLAGCSSGVPCIDNSSGYVPHRVPSALYGIEGQPLSVTLDQAFSSCTIAPTSFQTAVRVVRPDNTGFELHPDVSLNREYVESVIDFTPDVPGTWQIIVRFEPSLGRAQVPLEVAEARLSTVRHQAMLPVYPPSCRPQPWRTTNGTVLCEADGHISTFRSEAADLAFDGGQLVVVGNAVWSLGDDGRLQRWVDTGSALELRASAVTPGVPVDDQGFTSESTAIRAFTEVDGGRTLVRYDLTDGGLTVSTSRAEYDDVALVADAQSYLFTADPTTLVGFRACQETGGECLSVDAAPTVVTATGEVWLPHGSEYELLRPPFHSASARVVRPAADDWAFEPRGYLRRTLVSAEALTVTNVVNGDSMVVRGDGSLAWYGAGSMLGTRGNSVVLHTGGHQVTFVDF